MYRSIATNTFFLYLTCFGSARRLDCTSNDSFTYGTSSYKLISKAHYLVQITRCERLGGSLFVPNSREEYQIVGNRLLQMNVSMFYIGMAILSGDCEPKWQMPHGMDIGELESLNNTRSYRLLREELETPAATMTSSDLSFHFWNYGHVHPALCERNATYVEYSAEDLEFTYWNSSAAAHIEERGDSRGWTVRDLCHLYEKCILSPPIRKTNEHMAYLLRGLDRTIFHLAGLHFGASGALKLADFAYNTALHRRRVGGTAKELCDRESSLSK